MFKGKLCGRWAAVVNLENVFLFPVCTECLRRCAVICSLWGRTRLPKHPPFSWPAKLPWSNGVVGVHSPFSVSTRISSGSCTSSLSWQDHCTAQPGDGLRRRAVEDTASHRPWARQQLGKARAMDEFWAFFNSSAEEFRKRKGEKRRIDSKMRKQKFAEDHACWPVLSSFRCMSCLDLKTFFARCKKKKAVWTLLLCNIQQYNVSNRAWKIHVIGSFAWHRQIEKPPASIASRVVCR